MECNWEVGQKIVCIAKNWGLDGSGWATDTKPVYGRVYTIRELTTQRTEGVGVRLTEIVNQPHMFLGCGVVEDSWPVRAFRPIIERKTDISMFTKILTPTLEDA